MTVLNLENEIKKELKNQDAWTEQIAHFLWAIAWFLNTWIVTTTVVLGFTVSLLLLSPSESAEIISSNGNEFLEGFKLLFIVISGLSAFVVLIFGLPKKVRNIFKEVATNRVDRQKELFYQASLIEAVLIRHNLITDDQAEQAKAMRESITQQN